ncbi:MAG: hypothetical protein QHC40_07370 [Sphingobium sp.]|nr:hypothetical protein [Sphingobium sp.]
MSTDGKGAGSPGALYDDRPLCRQRRSSGVVLAIVAIALLLAIGFFFLAGRHPGSKEDAALTKAARTVDDGARSIGDAASHTLDRLRNNDRDRK